MKRNYVQPIFELMLDDIDRVFCLSDSPNSFGSTDMDPSWGSLGGGVK